MAKKPKKKKQSARARAELRATEVDPATGEDRRGEAVTVAWMLTMLATTAADVLSALMFAVLPFVFAQADEPSEMSPLVFPRLLLLVAAVTGAACVSLTPLVYRFRRVPPPVQITVFGILVSVTPVLVLFTAAVQGW